MLQQVHIEHAAGPQPASHILSIQALCGWMVEMMWVEHTTYCVQSNCSTRWATSPYSGLITQPQLRATLCDEKRSVVELHLSYSAYFNFGDQPVWTEPSPSLSRFSPLLVMRTIHSHFWRTRHFILLLTYLAPSKFGISAQPFTLRFWLFFKLHLTHSYAIHR